MKSKPNDKVEKTKMKMKIKFFLLFFPLDMHDAMLNIYKNNNRKTL